MSYSIFPLRDNLSTFIEKLDSQTRDQVERAIVNRSPPTFTACYEQFKLAERGLSFSAFYRYARRLRAHARTHRMAELTASGQSEELLSRYISRELIDLLLADRPTPSRVIHRLADAYRMAAQVPLTRRRMNLESSRLQAVLSEPASDPQAPKGTP